MDYAIDLEEELGAKVLAVSIDDSQLSSSSAYGTREDGSTPFYWTKTKTSKGTLE